MTAEELKQELDNLICLQWRSETMRNHVWSKIQQYADKQLDGFADFVADNYEPEDADTTTIHDWLFKFKSNQE